MLAVDGSDLCIPYNPKETENYPLKTRTKKEISQLKVFILSIDLFLFLSQFLNLMALEVNWDFLNF